MASPFRALLLSALVVASAYADTSSSGEEDVCGLKYVSTGRDLDLDVDGFLQSVADQDPTFSSWKPIPDVQALPNPCLCVVRSGDDEDDAETVEDTAEIGAGDQVINCGSCGACSNSNDIAIYAEPQLFDFPCAIQLIVAKYTRLATIYGESDAVEWEEDDVEEADEIGRDAADLCLKDAVPFTDDCRECWTEAVTCTPSEPCTVVTGLIEVVPGTIVPVFDPTSPCGPVGAAVYTGASLDEIDPGVFFNCLACDARECEPDFLKCAGANRRRTGQSSPQLSLIQALYGQPTCDVLP